MKRRRVDNKHPVVPATTEAIHAAFASLTHTELSEVIAKAKEYHALVCADLMDLVPDEIWDRIISQFPPLEVCAVLPMDQKQVSSAY